MTDELQAGIDSMRDLIKDACITDIASASVYFFRELFDELDELRAQLAAANAKLDAVPEDDIRALYDEFDDSWALDPSVCAVRDWLDAQVQP